MVRERGPGSRSSVEVAQRTGNLARLGRAGGVLCMLHLAGCMVPSPGTTEPAAQDEEGGVLPPPGYGTLTQREVSLALVEGGVEILVTPLAPEVLVATAPDTYRRLSALVPALKGEAGRDTEPFLVSFHSVRDEVAFVPEDVQFLTRGQRARPVRIAPLTPGWGSRRVAQRVTESALYYFDRPVDLEGDLTLEYGRQRSREWSAILGRIQIERARARARAGPASPDL